MSHTPGTGGWVAAPPEVAHRCCQRAVAGLPDGSRPERTVAEPNARNMVPEWWKVADGMPSSQCLRRAGSRAPHRRRRIARTFCEDSRGTRSLRNYASPLQSIAPPRATFTSEAERAHKRARNFLCDAPGEGGARLSVGQRSKILVKSLPDPWACAPLTARAAPRSAAAAPLAAFPPDSVSALSSHVHTGAQRAGRLPTQAPEGAVCVPASAARRRLVPVQAGLPWRG